MKNYIILTPIVTALAICPIYAKDDAKEKPTPAELIEKHDSDDDGKLDEAELTALLKDMPKKGGKKKKSE